MIPFLKDYLFAISQLRDPRLWKPVLWATLLSLGSIFFTVLIAGTLIFQTVDSLSQSLTYWMSWADGWIAGIATVLGTFFIAMLGYFFLVNVYAAILGIFIDGALDDVHDTHFPNTNWNKPPGIIESILSSIRFILWSLFIYLLASPLLLVGYFLPPIGLILQFLLGGFLLSREYGQLIEMRIPREQRLQKPGKLIHGTVATALWLIPVVNLVAPLLLAVSLMHNRLGEQNQGLKYSKIRQV